MQSSQLSYHGGQAPILHFETDLRTVVAWVNAHPALSVHALEYRLVFFRGPQQSCVCLGEINGAAVQARDWRAHREGKAGGVPAGAPLSVAPGRAHRRSAGRLSTTMWSIPYASHRRRPTVEVRADWCY
jgi:hypothetical protein